MYAHIAEMAAYHAEAMFIPRKINLLRLITLYL